VAVGGQYVGAGGWDQFLFCVGDCLEGRAANLDKLFIGSLPFMPLPKRPAGRFVLGRAPKFAGGGNWTTAGRLLQQKLGLPMAVGGAARAAAFVAQAVAVLAGIYSFYEIGKVCL
jgi:hypothetical protein